MLRKSDAAKLRVTTWRYIQVRIGYWKEKIYQARSRQEIIDGAFGRWRGAGRLDY